jgi:outer membrane receptor protein involved in Fe transport
MEGGINEGRGSWIVSARKSFLEALDDVVGLSSIGLTAIPKYWDAQGKAVYDLSSSQQLIFSGIYGDDRIGEKGKPTKKDLSMAGRTDSSAIGSFDFASKQYALGLSLKSLWGAKGYSVLTVSGIGNQYRINSSDDYIIRTYDKTGEVSNYRIMNSRETFRMEATEVLAGVKYEFFYQPHTAHEISAGVNYLTTWKFDDFSTWVPDTMRYDLNHDGRFDTGPVTFPIGEVRHRYGFGDQSKWYAYASDKIRLIPSLTLTLGGRYDYFSFSEKGNFSPRVSLSYELTPMITRINLAYGDYYQTQSLPLYADNRNIGYNQHLENSHSRHFVAGIEHILDEGLKVSVEAYYKNYDKLPVDEEFIYYSADNTFRSDKILNIGKRKSYGIEFFLQQKQVKDYYGTFSYSYSKTMEEDPRIPQQVDQYPFTYDFPHIFTLIMGKVIKGTRAALDEMPFFIKYPAMIFPISDDMEISFKFHYQTGRPYTPKVFMTDRQYRIGGGLWSRGGWIDGDQRNSARYPDYHRLDFQWLSRYHLSGWNIEIYIVIQNLYNRGNVLDINYRSDGTTENLYQFSFFPVGGIAIEF